MFSPSAGHVLYRRARGVFARRSCSSARLRPSRGSGRDCVASTFVNEPNDGAEREPRQHDAKFARIFLDRVAVRARRARNSGRAIKTRERSFPAVNSRRDSYTLVKPFDSRVSSPDRRVAEPRFGRESREPRCVSSLFDSERATPLRMPQGAQRINHHSVLN